MRVAVLPCCAESSELWQEAFDPFAQTSGSMVSGRVRSPSSEDGEEKDRNYQSYNCTALADSNKLYYGITRVATATLKDS